MPSWHETQEALRQRRIKVTCLPVQWLLSLLQELLPMLSSHVNIISRRATLRIAEATQHLLDSPRGIAAAPMSTVPV